MPRVDRDYIFEQLGDFHQRKEWYNFRCPYHRGESSNFGVSFRGNRYHCFSCGASGPVGQLVRDLRRGIAEGFGGSGGMLGGIRAAEAKDDTSPAVLKRLNGAGSPGSDADRVDRWFRDRYEALPTHGEVSSLSLSAQMGLTYLQRRGVDGRYLDVGLLEGYEGRVVFPFYDRGKVVFFQGRSFVPSPLKTINPDVDDGWYPKTDVLFQLEKLGTGDSVVLTEGIFDALKVQQSMPRASATCLLGKTISQRQIRLLRSAGVVHVTVFLDGDANSEAAELAIKLYKHKFAVRLVQYPRHLVEADPGSLSSADIRALLLSAQSIGPASEIQLALLSA